MTSRTLRRQLFRSHLQVMFVAIGVMVAVTIAGFVLVILITGDDFVIGRGSPHMSREEEDAYPVWRQIPGREHAALRSRHACHHATLRDPGRQDDRDAALCDLGHGPSHLRTRPTASERLNDDGRDPRPDQGAHPGGVEEDGGEGGDRGLELAGVHSRRDWRVRAVTAAAGGRA